MARELSLANKCQILFGAAIVLIIAAALSVPWVRLGQIVEESQTATVNEIAAFAADPDASWAPLAEFLAPPAPPAPGARAPREPQVRLASAQPSEFAQVEAAGGFAAAALERFRSQPGSRSMSQTAEVDGRHVRRHALAMRDDSGALTRLTLVEHRSRRAVGRLFTHRLYLLLAGLVAGAVAVLVFYYITTRLILSPVQELRDTAARVGEGNLAVRARVNTGDEFEQLADSFNSMLASIEQTERRLREINSSLDLKVAELSEANVHLHQSAALKNDFIASVSHELRTPLNSIIGFAELLQDIARKEEPADGSPAAPQYEKRQRYLVNIVRAGRSLLEMINELLDMAKIEAGKVELRIERSNVGALCEGLVALIRPQAERKGIDIAVEAPSEADALVVETDPRKLEQIVFNFLSNAVKFTPDGGRVTLRAERLGAGKEPGVRISVIDTGPGIAPADQERIFDSFTRVESGPTREHAGAGLGLAIAQRLTAMIQGEIMLDSDLGRGSMFSVVLPPRLDPDRTVDLTMRLAGRTPEPRAAAGAAEPRAADRAESLAAVAAPSPAD